MDQGIQALLENLRKNVLGHHHSRLNALEPVQQLRCDLRKPGQHGASTALRMRRKMAGLNSPAMGVTREQLRPQAVTWLTCYWRTAEPPAAADPPQRRCLLLLLAGCLVHAPLEACNDAAPLATWLASQWS